MSNLTSISKNLGSFLKKNNFTISTAESLTGGKISSTIVKTPGASAYFQGGLIAYDNEIKVNILKVSLQTVKKYGAVSEQCAKQMASGAKNLFKTDISISVTGIAGPKGGTAKKPVGLVYACIVMQKKSWNLKYNFKGSRTQIINQCISRILKDTLKLCGAVS